MTIQQEHEDKAKLAQRQLQKNLFLNGVRVEGTVAAGLRKAGMAGSLDYKTIKRWLARDETFADAYKDALAEFKDALKDKLFKRLEKSSDTTLRLVIKSLIPEEFGTHKDRQSAAGAPLSIDEQWAALEHAAAAPQEDPQRQSLL